MSTPIPLPKSFARLEPIPIDRDSLFATYSDLTAYATTRANAYPGLICSVTATNTPYIINSDKSVTPLITLSGDISQTVLRYLSTNNITISSLIVTSNISAGNIIYALSGNSNLWNIAYNVSTAYQGVSGSFATNTALNATSSVLLPTSIYQNASGNWTGGYKVLTSNEYNLDCSSYGLFFKEVTSSNVFTYSNFNPGQSITIYLSAGHPLSMVHYFPVGTFLQKAGEANYAYTYTGRVTKITIHNMGNEYFGVANTIATNIPPQYSIFSIDSQDSLLTIDGDTVATI